MKSKERIQKEKDREYELNKERDYLVVKDNNLIQEGRLHLSATQQKFVSYVISKIQPTDTCFQRYQISVKDFAEICGVDPKNAYREFKKMIDDMDENAVWININGLNTKFRWFSESDYIENKGIMRVMLHSQLQTYLLGLDSNFTEYNLWNILAFKCKYSIRLYELLKSYVWTKKKLVCKVDDLKMALGATNYVQYTDFRKRALDKAVQEINHYSDIALSYTEIKSGKRITEIEFTMSRKESMDSLEAYTKTIEQIKRINKKNKQIEGQLRMTDDGMIEEE